MDNKIFDVNGKTLEQLKMSLKLVLLDEYGKECKVEGFYFLEERGIVLVWHADKTNDKVKQFTNNFGETISPSSDELAVILLNWLKTSSQVATVTLGEWEHDQKDDDISTSLGWRLYTEEWGHVNGKYSLDHYSIAAFNPMYLWYGK